MFRLFKTDPTKKLRREYERKLTQAHEAQRSGDIRTYSNLTAEAEALYARIKAAEKTDP